MTSDNLLLCQERVRCAALLSLFLSDLSQSVRIPILIHKVICFLSTLNWGKREQRWYLFSCHTLGNKQRGKSEEAKGTTALPSNGNWKWVNTERLSPVHNPSFFTGHLYWYFKNEVIFNYQILFRALTSLISFSLSQYVCVCCWNLTKSLGYLRQDCLSCGLLVTGLQNMINGRVMILTYWPGSLGLWAAVRNQSSG